MIIPTENRATMKAYRVGLSEKQFISLMWKRRRVENPGPTKPRGKWPPTCRTLKGFLLKSEPNNVTQIIKVRANG